MNSADGSIKLRDLKRGELVYVRDEAGAIKIGVVLKVFKTRCRLIPLSGESRLTDVAVHFAKTATSARWLSTPQEGDTGIFSITKEEILSCPPMFKSIASDSQRASEMIDFALLLAANASTSMEDYLILKNRVKL